MHSRPYYRQDRRKENTWGYRKLRNRDIDHVRDKADYASQGLGGSYDPSKAKSSKGGGGKKGGGGSKKDKTKSADEIEKKKLKDT